MHHRKVTSSTLAGAIAAYLLIATAYFFAFLTVGGWQGTFFASPDEVSSSYMYFSLTTITTVGYGDLTAQTHLGRLLANSEAVVGQVYLVTFVAMIVGLRAQEWRGRGAGPGCAGRGARDLGLSAAPMLGLGATRASGYHSRRRRSARVEGLGVWGNWQPN